MVTSIPIDFAGERFLADTRRALYWRGQGTLIIADLHIGKAQDYTARGTLLPPYEMQDICERLVHLIRDYEPARIICLGDSFHRKTSFDALTADDKSCLAATMTTVPLWLFVEGNHDAGLSGTNWRLHDKVSERGFTMLHQPEKSAVLPQITGHFHPKFTRRIGARKLVSKPCFAWDEKTLILPAFGTYAGGLDAEGDVIKALFGNDYFIATANTLPSPAQFMIKGHCQAKTG